MGHLLYAGATEYYIDDRMLAHVKVAASAKLRRQECFLLSWEIEASHGSGRVSLWLSPAIPLQFQFSGSRVPELNPVWLEALVETGNSARGMVLMSEGEAAEHVRRIRASIAAQ
jgi:hypothetical protein